MSDEYRLPSYKADKYCDCMFHKKDEPCWGVVTIIDEKYLGGDYGVAYCFACEGHVDMLCRKEYKRSTYEIDK